MGSKGSKHEIELLMGVSFDLPLWWKLWWRNYENKSQTTRPSQKCRSGLYLSYNYLSMQNHNLKTNWHIINLYESQMNLKIQRRNQSRHFPNNITYSSLSTAVVTIPCTFLASLMDHASWALQMLLWGLFWNCVY